MKRTKHRASWTMILACSCIRIVYPGDNLEQLLKELTETRAADELWPRVFCAVHGCSLPMLLAVPNNEGGMLVYGRDIGYVPESEG